MKNLAVCLMILLTGCAMLPLKHDQLVVPANLRTCPLPTPPPPQLPPVRTVEQLADNHNKSRVISNRNSAVLDTCRDKVIDLNALIDTFNRR